ncbi:YdcF family protein [Microvirga mediterraneensis]|uniref:YdcF family protein n=1 Tax=Microvirga mediterraneensis TaxID=2754695 RepID=A0A838BME0_9HYPH|nr:YdcF family protein [Microvirga mediterraneensis]MBA1156511.1 YdcF family protein [Microvirga mediterraneensis]
MRKFATIGAATLLALSIPVTAHAFDQGNTSRIKTLVDTGMQYYWSGGDVKKAEAEIFKGITLHGRYDVVEKAFAEASTLAPERLDFRFAVASSQILQKNLSGARATYQDILAKSPASFDAQAWLAALARIEGQADEVALTDQALAALDRDRAEAYRQRFARAESIMAERPNVDVPTVSGRVMIVALGYALAKDGTAEKPLLDRLDVALKAANANPSARVMVTGGQPQAGVTEGDVMTKWLVEKGVDRDRILIEDKSKDTVGNVLNVANLLKRHTADAVILVTSSSHMRRARTLLEDAFRQYGLTAPILPVVALDAPSVEEAAKVSKDERMVIYRDLMRVSGLWAYPGIQQ